MREVEHWIRSEGENQELKHRVATALGEIKLFIGERQSELERRRAKLLQTGGFKGETRAMEAALANIRQLLSGGRNISHIFWEIDKYLNTYKVDDSLSRLHTRTELAEARDEFMCAFHDSIRGTRLAELLDILYFMPFAYWRSRGLERRNYRSPSATEILQLLAELGRLKIDCNRIDTVQLAAVIRMQLGITPRMDYHKMSANRLAEQLTDGETLTRFTARAMPLDEGFCRAAGGILGNIRRWSAEFFGSTGWLAPAEIEAEMLQIVFLAGETIRIAGTETERPTDFLWLLATVIASSHTTLKDVLTWPAVRNTRYSSVAGRISGTKTYLDRIAVLADRILVARWSEARVELNALTARSETIASKRSHDYGEFTELEQLKDRRSVAGKSLIKISDSLQLLEPVLLDMLAAPGDTAALPLLGEHLRALDPAALMDRNRAIAEETRLVTRQELEKLRVLIGRITTISRQGFAASPDQEELDRLRATGKSIRKTAEGVDIGTLPAAGLQAMLLGSLRKAAVSVRECRSRVEGARKRGLKSDLLQALNMFLEKIKKAADLCDGIDAGTVAAAAAPAAAATVSRLLRELMTAQTIFSGRLNSLKTTPAEKQSLTSLLYAMKTRLNDDLKDIDSLRAELAERIVAAPNGSAVLEMAGLAAAANGALKPVKELMARLSATISDRQRDNRAVVAATHDLRNGIRVARELMAGNLALINTIAAAAALTNGEYIDKFDLWQRQLAAVEIETGHLLQATEGIAAGEAAVKTAAALERELTAARNDGELPSTRERCAQALVTIARSLHQVREAREACATAAKAERRLLKTASGYLESAGSSFGACEAALESTRARIEKLHEARPGGASDHCTV